MPRIDIFRRFGDGTYRIEKTDIDPTWPALIRGKTSDTSLFEEPLFPEVTPLRAETWDELVAMAGASGDKAIVADVSQTRKSMLVVDGDNLFPLTHGNDLPNVDREARSAEFQRINTIRYQRSKFEAGKRDLNPALLSIGFMAAVAGVALITVALVAVFLVQYLQSQSLTTSSPANFPSGAVGLGGLLMLGGLRFWKRKPVDLDAGAPLTQSRMQQLVDRMKIQRKPKDARSWETVAVYRPLGQALRVMCPVEEIHKHLDVRCRVRPTTALPAFLGVVLFAFIGSVIVTAVVLAGFLALGVPAWQLLTPSGFMLDGIVWIAGFTLSALLGGPFGARWGKRHPKAPQPFWTAELRTEGDVAVVSPRMFGDNIDPLDARTGTNIHNVIESRDTLQLFSSGLNSTQRLQVTGIFVLLGCMTFIMFMVITAMGS